MMQTATEKSKAAIAELIAGAPLPTAEKSRHLWLSVAGMMDAAKRAEHSAFLIMRELENKNPEDAVTFNNALIAQLGEVKEQLVFIGVVIRGN